MKETVNNVLEREIHGGYMNGISATSEMKRKMQVILSSQ